MVNLNATQVTIGGRFYNNDKSGYPSSPTIFSGVEVQWGAESCIEHPDASRATLSLWIPKLHEAWMPTLGEVVTVNANLRPNENDTQYTSFVRVFTGKVESIKLQDDKKPATPSPISSTSKTGWALRHNLTTPQSTRSDWSPYVTMFDGDMFSYPFSGSGTNWFFTKTPKFNVQGGKSYTLTWESNYNSLFTGEVRYYNGAGAQIGTTTTIISISERRISFVPPADAVTADVEIYAGMAVNYTSVSSVGAYRIGKFMLGTPDASGFRVNITAADALAEAARLRLSDQPWGFAPVYSRQNRIYVLADKHGVKFDGWPSDEQGYVEASDTWVGPRDVDSFPALEAYQRATMAAGHTVISADNTVQPSLKLNLPQVLGASQPASGTVYSYTTDPIGRHEMRVNGVLTRTNWASFATGRNGKGEHFTGGVYTAVSGTGGSAAIGTSGLTNGEDDFADVKNGGEAIQTYWDVSATGGTQGFYYQQGAGSITGAAASKVSAGMWIKANVAKTIKLQVNLFNGATPAGTGITANINLVKDVWQWIKLDGVTATAAYNTVQVYVQAQSNMARYDIFYADGVLIEKTATSGTYFDSNTLAPTADIIAVERTGLPVFDSSAIVDDVFEIDTSKVVNEIKVEFKTVTGTGDWDYVSEDADQVFTDEASSKKTTPQTRSIATDWAEHVNYMEDVLPTSVMVTKAKLLLAGQSKPQWRMSSALRLVLGEVPAQEATYTLLKELTRFGALIKITNGPSFVSEYMRVRGGKIVLGDEAALEFDLEPVEYSAPIPLSGATLSADFYAANYRIRNFKTLTSNDLRTIGAR